MNLDFSNPTPHMIKMAKESNIDLKDSRVLFEFKLIQQQNLTDIRRMREGKPAMTADEITEMRQKAYAEANFGTFQFTKEQEAVRLGKTEAVVEEVKEGKVDSKGSDKWDWESVMVVIGIVFWTVLCLYFNFAM